MATDPISYTGRYEQGLGSWPDPANVVNVAAEGGEGLSQLEQMDHYFMLREAAAAEPIPDDGTVARIQKDVDTWLRDQLTPDKLPYRLPPGDYDQGTVNRFRDLVGFLRDKYGDQVPATVLDASEAFIDMVTGMHDAYRRGERIDAGAEGRFGFVVPARGSETRPEDSVETIGPCPVTRYVSPELRLAMFAGLPPFVLDRYAQDEQGRWGYMLFAGAYPDMMGHLMRSQGLKDYEAAAVVKGMANETVQFGRDFLGTKVFGLGAWLPGATRHGRDITVEDVITTTGHGGTIALIIKTIRALEARGAVSEGATQRIGLLGYGSIGASIATVIRTIHPTAQFVLYDKTFDADARRGTSTDPKQKALTNLAANNGSGKVIAASSVQEVLESSDIIISAVTEPIDLVDLYKLGAPDLGGKVIVDDSQPWAFRRKQVEAAGGRTVWVGGESLRGVAERETSWNYGGTLLPGTRFGCEIEADILSRILSEVSSDSEFANAVDRDTGKHITPFELVQGLALRRAVTPEDALIYLHLLDRYVVEAAPFQAEGQPTEFPGMPASHENTSTQPIPMTRIRRTIRQLISGGVHLPIF